MTTPPGTRPYHSRALEEARQKLIWRKRRRRIILAAELIAFMLLAVIIGFARAPMAIIR